MRPAFLTLVHPSGRPLSDTPGGMNETVSLPMEASLSLISSFSVWFSRAVRLPSNVLSNTATLSSVKDRFSKSLLSNRKDTKHRRGGRPDCLRKSMRRPRLAHRSYKSALTGPRLRLSVRLPSKARLMSHRSPCSWKGHLAINLLRVIGTLEPAKVGFQQLHFD